MPTVAYPSLTREGWVKAPDRKADRILTAIFASDKSQDPRYAVEVTSVQWTVSAYQHDPIRLEEEIADLFETVYRRYYEMAVFQVNVKPIPTDPGRLEIELSGTVIQDGLKYSFGRLVAMKDGVFQTMKEITYR